MEQRCKLSITANKIQNIPTTLDFFQQYDKVNPELKS